MNTYYRSRKGLLRIERRDAAILRLLPYGEWRCVTGRTVLFDRDYAPICEKWPDGSVTLADGEEWVEGIAHETWLYNDATPSRTRRLRSIAALRAWGTEHIVMSDIEVRLASVRARRSPSSAVRNARRFLSGWR